MINCGNYNTGESSDVVSILNIENGNAQPLLQTDLEEIQEAEDDDLDVNVSEKSAEESRKPATSFRSAYRLLTPSVKVCFYYSLYPPHSNIFQHISITFMIFHSTELILIIQNIDDIILTCCYNFLTYNRFNC